MRIRLVGLALRALLAAAVLLNGVAVTPAADAAPPDAPAPHAGHAGHGDMPGHDGAAPAGDPATQDCCDGPACECGCLLPPAALPRPAMRVAPSAKSPLPAAVPDLGPPAASFDAPFRPPA